MFFTISVKEQEEEAIAEKGDSETGNRLITQTQRVGGWGVRTSGQGWVPVLDS